MSRLVLVTALLAALLSGCRVEVGAPEGRPEAETAEVWVYTSMYQEVIDEMTPLLQRDLPNVKVAWFQAGSEKVAQRWEAEDEAGGSHACVLATSDPGWYIGLAERGELAAYVSPRALELDRAWVRPHYAAFRVSLMVLASSGSEAPSSFRELTEPKWQGRFSTPDPLASGTMFTTLAAWDQVFGPEWLARAKGNGWVAAGGSSAVLARLSSGEKPVGVLLLENLLAKADAPRPVIPTEGAVPVPGYVGVTTDCPSPAAARKVVDWLMGPAAQEAIVHGKMHSPFPGAAPPAGAPPLAEIALLPLPDDFGARTVAGADALKQRWQELSR